MRALVLFLALGLVSCETLSQPAFDATGNPIVVSDQPVTIPVGDGTITVTPASSEPRPGDLGDALVGVGSQVLAGATGQPWLVPVIGGLAGLFRRRKKPA